MAFRDLSELLDAGLSLSINGKTYTVPPVDAETGLRLQRLAELAAETGEPLDAVMLDLPASWTCTGRFRMRGLQFR